MARVFAIFSPRSGHCRHSIAVMSALSPKLPALGQQTDTFLLSKIYLDCSKSCHDLMLNIYD